MHLNVRKLGPSTSIHTDSESNTVIQEKRMEKARGSFIPLVVWSPKAETKKTKKTVAVTSTTSVKPNERKEGKAWPESQAYSGGAAVGYGSAEYRREMRILSVPKSIIYSLFFLWSRYLGMQQNVFFCRIVDL